MIGHCNIEINGKEYGALFGVHLFNIINREGFKLDEDPSNVMNGIYTVWAAILNNAELDGVDLDVTFKEFYAQVNNDSKDFEKAIKCFEQSKIMGRPVLEVAEDVKKKTKRKRSILGRLFQRTV